MEIAERAENLRVRMADQMQQGVLAFPLTSFTEDGEQVDVDGFTAHIRRHIDTGAAALFVACGTGEFPALTEDEFRTVVRAAVAEAKGEVPVLAGAGYGWVQARRFVQIAAEEGIDGILAMPPYLARGSQAGMVEHIRRIAVTSPLPLIVYHRDLMVLSGVSVAELSRLDAVIGLKDGHSNFLELQRMQLATDDTFLWFNGSLTAEMQYRPYAAVGIAPYSSAVQSFLPEVSRAFFLAARDGDQVRMDELLTGFFSPLVEIRDRVPGYAVSLVKAGARLRGEQVGPVRAPLVDPSEADLADLAALIETGLALVR